MVSVLLAVHRKSTCSAAQSRQGIEIDANEVRVESELAGKKRAANYWATFFIHNRIMRTLLAPMGVTSRALNNIIIRTLLASTGVSR